MEGFSVADLVLEPLSWVTGPCIQPGACANCHTKTKDASGPGSVESWDTPAFSCPAQIITKASLMLIGGLAGFLFGGGWYALGGAVAGNIIARPIVDAYAVASGPAHPEGVK